MKIRNPAMTVLANNSSNGHEYIIRLNDGNTGLKAFIAIHSTALGPAHGGTRLKTYDSEEEALNDALQLSKAMSYKSAVSGLPYGGAKGVIMLPKNIKAKHKKDILIAYARKVDALGGIFHTGTDVGISDEDDILMSKYCRFIVGLPKPKSHLSTSYFAARGVMWAIMASVKFKYNKKDLEGITVGIKGLGKLGGELASLLLEKNANLIIADIDENKLKPFINDQRVRIVDPSLIHKQAVNIYAPCALGNEFDDQRVAELDCDIIVGGANNQLTDPAVAETIFKRGIVYIPDYVANAGGLIFASEDLEANGFDEKRVYRRLDNIYNTVLTLLKRAKRESLPPLAVADRVALDRINSRKHDN